MFAFIFFASALLVRPYVGDANFGIRARYLLEVALAFEYFETQVNTNLFIVTIQLINSRWKKFSMRMGFSRTSNLIFCRSFTESFPKDSRRTTTCTLIRLFLYLGTPLMRIMHALSKMLQKKRFFKLYFNLVLLKPWDLMVCILFFFFKNVWPTIDKNITCVV